MKTETRKKILDSWIKWLADEANWASITDWCKSLDMILNVSDVTFECQHPIWHVAWSDWSKDWETGYKLASVLTVYLTCRKTCHNSKVSFDKISGVISAKPWGRPLPSHVFPSLPSPLPLEVSPLNPARIKFHFFFAASINLSTSMLMPAIINIHGSRALHNEGSSAPRCVPHWHCAQYGAVLRCILLLYSLPERIEQQNVAQYCVALLSVWILQLISM